MNEIVGRFFLYNGQIKLVGDYNKYCLNIKFDVYEVIRVINGVPVFYEDHFARMIKSLQLLNKSLNIDISEFEYEIKLIADRNSIQNGNVKISIGYEEQDTVMHFIPHYYPSDNEYQFGVKTGFYYAERINPNVKAHLVDLRKNVNAYLNNNGLFEVFYVDRNNEITEGSRTNVFFIRGDKVFTCPPEKVLLGITRQKVIECLKELNIQIFETNILKDEISSYDAVFLTGTSPKILPVAAIDNITFSCNNKIMTKIRLEYDRMMEQYVNSKLS